MVHVRVLLFSFTWKISKRLRAWRSWRTSREVRRCYPILKGFFLVGGWTNPSEKYARQIGFIFPKVRGENSKNIELPRPSNYSLVVLFSSKKNQPSHQVIGNLFTNFLEGIQIKKWLESMWLAPPNSVDINNQLVAFHQPIWTKVSQNSRIGLKITVHDWVNLLRSWWKKHFMCRTNLGGNSWLVPPFFPPQEIARGVPLWIKGLWMKTHWFSLLACPMNWVNG